MGSRGKAMGKIMDWEEHLLESIADELTVGYVGPMATEYVESGIPFLRSKNVEPFNIDWKDMKYITNDFHRRIKKSALKPGDVVIVRTGKPGAAAIIPDSLEDANCSDLVIIRPGRNLDARFLVYYLNSIATQHIDAHLVGAVQQHFNVGAARMLKMRIPSINEQRVIADSLGSLDEKIRLNFQINSSLEKLAQALFQRWFVENYSVRLPETETDRTHWTEQSLDDIAHFLNGLALQKYPPGDGTTLPVIKIAQLRKGDVYGADRCDTAIPGEYIVNDGDVLFSWSGSLEVEVWCGGLGALNQHLFKVTSSQFPKWFYYLWTLHHLPNFRLIAADKATTMGHIQRKHLTLAKVLVPPPHTMERMTITMKPLLERMIANRVQSRTLAALRDALLPKLLSGELRVPDAEREIGRHV